MNWRTKALIQRVLSRAPAGDRIYYLGQRYLGGFRHFTADQRIRDGLDLLRCLGKFDGGPPQRALEIGTGWVPILPLVFWLTGQDECDTFDISRLFKDSLLIESARQLLSFEIRTTLRPLACEARARFDARVDMLAGLVAAGASAGDILRACGIRYHAPANAAHTGLADESIDLVYSNNVLEHVAEAAVHELFQESHRILRRGGFMLHAIDLTDHFSHSDSRISAFNFLKFSDDQFSKYNTRFCFQNRLRAPRWHRLFVEHGFEIGRWQTTIDDRALTEWPPARLDDAFRNSSPAEACIERLVVLATRP